MSLKAVEIGGKTLLNGYSKIREIGSAVLFHNRVTIHTTNYYIRQKI